MSAKNLTIRFTERQHERVTYLLKATKAPTEQDVIRDALRLYDAMVQEHEDGNKAAVVKPDGTVVAYDITRIFATRDA